MAPVGALGGRPVNTTVRSYLARFPSGPGMIGTYSPDARRAAGGSAQCADLSITSELGWRPCQIGLIGTSDCRHRSAEVPDFPSLIHVASDPLPPTSIPPPPVRSARRRDGIPRHLEQALEEVGLARSLLQGGTNPRSRRAPLKTTTGGERQHGGFQRIRVDMVEDPPVSEEVPSTSFAELDGNGNDVVHDLHCVMTTRSRSALIIALTSADPAGGRYRAWRGIPLGDCVGSAEVYLHISLALNPPALTVEAAIRKRLQR